MKIVIKRTKPNEPALCGCQYYLFPFFLQVVEITDHEPHKIGHIIDIPVHHGVPGTCFKRISSAKEFAKEATLKLQANL